MATTAQPVGKPLEYRAEVESLEALQAERRKILPRYAELAAKFKGGSSASADSKRKQHRALVMTRIRQSLDWKDGAKEPAENWLERMANADLEHIQFCEKLEREFTEYVLLDYQLTEIQERIRSREVELYCYKAETQLQG